MTFGTSHGRKTPRKRAAVQQGDVLGISELREIQSERDFQREVERLLDMGKWRWHHEVDSRKSKRGLPDLIAVRGDRLIFAELKSQRGTVTDEQAAWLEHLVDMGCHQVESYVWRPANLDEIAEILK